MAAPTITFDDYDGDGESPPGLTSRGTSVTGYNPYTPGTLSPRGVRPHPGSASPTGTENSLFGAGRVNPIFFQFRTEFDQSMFTLTDSLRANDSRLTDDHLASIREALYARVDEFPALAKTDITDKGAGFYLDTGVERRLTPDASVSCRINLMGQYTIPETPERGPSGEEEAMDEGQDTETKKLAPFTIEFRYCLTDDHLDIGDLELSTQDPGQSQRSEVIDDRTQNDGKMEAIFRLIGPPTLPSSDRLRYHSVEKLVEAFAQYTDKQKRSTQFLTYLSLSLGNPSDSFTFVDFDPEVDDTSMLGASSFSKRLRPQSATPTPEPDKRARRDDASLS